MGPPTVLALVAVLWWLAANAHTPLLRKVRGGLAPAVYLGAAMALVVLALRLLRVMRGRSGNGPATEAAPGAPSTPRGLRRHTTAVLVLGLLGAAVILDGSALYRDGARGRALAADPALLQRVGRHVVVGFDRFEDVRPLVARGLVGGVFVTARNVEGRTAEELAGAIASLHRARAAAGLPPLLVMADQEGGGVSRLSPPLPRLPTLAEVAPPRLGDREATARAHTYGRWQAEDLEALGLNLNLAPVVDVPSVEPGLLDPWGRIAARALGRDPERVADLAAAYVEASADAGVIATLKHFPGLGRTTQDTHIAEAPIAADPDTLAATDWLPYRRVLETGAEVAVMVGHPRLTAVDPDRPASLSPAVIRGLLRGRLGHQGLVLTDDLCMAPTFQAPGGIGASAVSALGAGADLVLVTYDPSQLWPVLDALVRAAEAGTLTPEELTAGAARIDHALEAIAAP